MQSMVEGQKSKSATASYGPQGTVVNIQRMSTEDGPGLRTTVFLKGCSLECSWCHNPEALCAKRELVWHDWKCIGSKNCSAVCPEDAITHRDSKVAIDFGSCTFCGDCVDNCPTTALELLGKRWHVDDLVAEVAKDRSYFATGNGGVTVSGGEPGLQPTFVAEFLKRCRDLGLHTAVDTCGMCSPSSLQGVTAVADLVLYDVKEIDAERHRRFTGQSNEKILANLLELAAHMRHSLSPEQLWIRTPLIPGVTATDANILGIGGFIADNLSDVVGRWELCAFNNLARDKYRRLGRTWDFAETELLPTHTLRHFEEVARRSGVPPDIVVASGPTKVETRKQSVTRERLAR
jgi:pyruvate formate lyase activating enzyme